MCPHPITIMTVHLITIMTIHQITIMTIPLITIPNMTQFMTMGPTMAHDNPYPADSLYMMKMPLPNWHIWMPETANFTPRIVLIFTILYHLNAKFLKYYMLG